MTNPASIPDDPVNHPRHYRSHPSGIECITVVEHMGFNVGNAIKYLWRADEKGAPLEDLKKALWYIRREIAKREKERGDCEAVCSFGFTLGPDAASASGEKAGWRQCKLALGHIGDHVIAVLEGREHGKETSEG